MSEDSQDCGTRAGLGEAASVRPAKPLDAGSRPQMSQSETSPTQAQALGWVRERWPDRADPTCRALKLGEEAGEVQGAVIKMGEGRKTLADLAMETAQLVICAMALAESAGFDLQAAITAEWERLHA